jgi:hypothetical protein
VYRKKFRAIFNVEITPMAKVSLQDFEKEILPAILEGVELRWRDEFEADYVESSFDRLTKQGFNTVIPSRDQFEAQLPSALKKMEVWLRAEFAAGEMFEE